MLQDCSSWWDILIQPLNSFAKSSLYAISYCIGSTLFVPIILMLRSIALCFSRRIYLKSHQIIMVFTFLLCPSFDSAGTFVDCSRGTVE
jgi:xanthine/uracil/vitamin C permease (AzgA family)